MSWAVIPTALPAVMLWTATLNLYTYLQLLSVFIHVPVTAVGWSNVCVCGRSLARTVGSNPAAGMDTCLLLTVECCQRRLRRADHSSRGVLPIVVCLSVISKPQKWGGPGPLGAVAPWKKKIICGNNTCMFFVLWQHQGRILICLCIYINKISN